MKGLRQELDILMDFHKLSKQWRIGGPAQVKALLQWNSTTEFHPRNGSRAWATEEIKKLFAMETHMFLDAQSGEKRWQKLCTEENGKLRYQASINELSE